MNLHSEIMNIPVDDQKSQQAWGNADNDCMTIYKLGHRDARHVAAELSLKAEARIEELESLLSQMIYASIPVSNAAYNLAWQHRDQVGVHENVSILDGIRTKASELLKES